MVFSLGNKSMLIKSLNTTPAVLDIVAEAEFRFLIWLSIAVKKAATLILPA